MILNLIFPTWMMFLFVPWLLVISVIGNLIIDSTIYRIGLKNVNFKWESIWKYIIRAYLLGFLADIIVGIIVIIIVEQGLDYYHIYNDPLSIIVHALGVVATGVLIYYFNRWNLRKLDIDSSRAFRLAMMMAIITAPYTFLVPASLFFY